MLHRVLGLLLASAAVASAHDCWIEPVDPEPLEGREVGVRLFVGEPGQAEAFPRRPERVVRFVARGPQGEVPIEGAGGEEPAGTFRIGRGVHVLGYRNSHSVIELEASKFEEYLREEGLDEVSRLRAGRGETGKAGRERYSRCAKSILAGGRLRDGPGWETPLGLDLELVPEANPLLLAPGGELPVRVLLRGAPLAGAKVAAWSRARCDLRTSGRTDAEGRVRLRLPVGGRWVVTCVRMEATTDGGPQDWESLWSSLSFAAPGGPRFQTDVAALHSAALTGCAAGELDGAAGDELVAVGQDGAVLVARHEPRAWRSDVVAITSGELVAVATGELDGAPGDEVVVVGARAGAATDGAQGVALLLRRAGSTWRATTLLEDERVLSAVAILDGQLFVAGAGRAVVRLRRDPGGDGWLRDAVGALPGAARAASAPRPTSAGARPGSSVTFACADGSVVQASPSGDGAGWELRVVDQRPGGRARVHTGSAAALVADDDGLLSVVSSRQPRRTILELGVPLRGAASGALDPKGSQHQVTIAAANGEVSHAWLKDGEAAWTREVVARDAAELRDLALGQPLLVPAGRPEPCAVVASASGRLLVVRRAE